MQRFQIEIVNEIATSFAKEVLLHRCTIQTQCELYTIRKYVYENALIRQRRFYKKNSVMCEKVKFFKHFEKITGFHCFSALKTTNYGFFLVS